MKSFLSKLLILMVIVGNLATPFVALANHSYDHTVQQTNQQNQALNAPDKKEELRVQTCLQTSYGVPVGINFTACLAEVGNIAMSLFGRVLWLTGILLDYSIDYTINLKTFLEKVKVVDVGWRIFRDVGNMFFIFLILLIAIKLILGLGGGDDTKRSLLRLIIVALLINFSLFITQVVVDSSNIIALHFYGLINSGQATNDFAGVISGNGVASHFMQGLKLQTLYSGKAVVGFGGAVTAESADAWFRIAMVTILGSIFLLISSFVFLAAAILFITRTVVLIFLMMLSPLAFIAWIIPGTEKYSDEWWHTLLKQSFFAPLYLMLTYIVIQIVKSGAFSSLTKLTTDSGGLAAAVGGNDPRYVSAVFSFAVISALMMGCLVIAQKLGAGGAETLIKKGKSWGGGISGFANRRTIGRFSSYLDDKAGGTSRGNSQMGRAIRSVTTGALKDAKFGGTKKYSDDEKLFKDIKTQDIEIKKKSSTKKYSSEINDLDKKISNTTDPVVLAELNAKRQVKQQDLQNELSAMSGKNIVEMFADEMENKAFVSSLSPAQFKALTTSDTLDEKSRRNAVKSRGGDVIEYLQDWSSAKEKYDAEKEKFDRGETTVAPVMDKKFDETTTEGKALRARMDKRIGSIGAGEWAEYIKVKPDIFKNASTSSRLKQETVTELSKNEDVSRSMYIDNIKQGRVSNMKQSIDIFEEIDLSLTPQEGEEKRTEKINGYDTNNTVPSITAILQTPKGQRAISKLLESKNSHADIANAPDSVKNHPIMLNMMDSASFTQTRKEPKDQQKVLDHLIRSLKGGELTTANKELLKWILTSRKGSESVGAGTVSSDLQGTWDDLRSHVGVGQTQELENVLNNTLRIQGINNRVQTINLQSAVAQQRARGAGNAPAGGNPNTPPVGGAPAPTVRIANPQQRNQQARGNNQNPPAQPTNPPPPPQNPPAPQNPPQPPANPTPPTGGTTPPPPPPPTPQKGSSVPFMITRQMEIDLMARGYNQADINKMTPQQAHDNLK